MIRPLRQRHRRLVRVLAVVLPVAFAIGVTARKPVPSMASLPDGVAAPKDSFTITEWQRTDLFATLPVIVEFMRAGERVDQVALRFHADENFVKPDLIVYWVAGSPAIADQLPHDALLLGALGAGVLPLPVEVAKRDGVLVLYSLADSEVVEVSKPLIAQGD